MLTAAIVVAGAGTVAVIAAPGAGKRIRVLYYALGGAGAITFKWQSAGNDLMGALQLGAGIPFGMGPFFDGIFDCNVNEALNLVTVGAFAVGGIVGYTVISG